MQLDQFNALADALKGQQAKQDAVAEFNSAIADRRNVQLQIQNPSIGRVILYKHAESGWVLLPGLILEVLDHESFEARVVVFGVRDGEGTTYKVPQYYDAPYDAAGTKVGCWSWPPRV